MHPATQTFAGHVAFPGFRQALRSHESTDPRWFPLAQRLNAARRARLVRLARLYLEIGGIVVERMGSEREPRWRCVPPAGSTLGRVESHRSPAEIADHVVARALGFGWPVSFA